MRARDQNLGAAGGVAHFHHVDLDPVALAEVLALDALVGHEHGLGKLAVGGDADGHRTVSRLDMADDAGEDLMLLGGELLVNDAALRLADALDDDLLCRLGGDAAELLGLHGNGDQIAELGAAADLPGGLEIDLVAGVLDLLHHGLHDVHLDALLVLVDDDLDIVLTLGIVAAESRQHGLTDFIVHIVAGNAFFLLDVLDGFKKFSVHASLSCNNSTDLMICAEAAMCAPMRLQSFLCPRRPKGPKPEGSSVRSPLRNPFRWGDQKETCRLTFAICGFSKLSVSPPTDRLSFPSS